VQFKRLCVASFKQMEMPMHLPWLYYPLLVYSIRLFVINRIYARQAKMQACGKSNEEVECHCK